MVHTVHTFEVPLYDPVGLVVYWPPRVLEDDIWTEDLMVAPRQTKAEQSKKVLYILLAN